MLAKTRLAVAVLCTVAAASAVQAQQRHIQPATNTVPSASARTAQSTPSPTGLTPRFPAGISSGSGAAVSTDPVGQSTSPVPAGGATIANTTAIPAELPPTVTAPGTSVTLTDSFGVPATTVLGAGAAYGPGAGSMVPGPAQRTAGGAGGINATDAARSFFFADGNKDGELTRAEFTRLGTATMSFEQMDRNFDGVISRFEYDDSLR